MGPGGGRDGLACGMHLAGRERILRGGAFTTDLFRRTALRRLSILYAFTPRKACRTLWILTLTRGLGARVHR